MTHRYDSGWSLLRLSSLVQLAVHIMYVLGVKLSARLEQFPLLFIFIVRKHWGGVHVLGKVEICCVCILWSLLWKLSMALMLDKSELHLSLLWDYILYSQLFFIKVLGTYFTQVFNDLLLELIIAFIRTWSGQVSLSRISDSIVLLYPALITHVNISLFDIKHILDTASLLNYWAARLCEVWLICNRVFCKPDFNSGNRLRWFVFVF